MAYLKDETDTIEMYVDLINIFLTSVKSKFGSRVINKAINEWSEIHPVLFENCKSKMKSRINKTVILQNLDRVYKKERSSIILLEFSLFTNYLVKLFTEITSRKVINKSFKISYLSLKKQHGNSPILLTILKNMPDGILEEEKLVLRSREELEQKVRERTKELEDALIAATETSKALVESEERFRSLVETTSDWIWEINLKGIYTYASPKVKDLLGYEPEEVIGKTQFDLMPPDVAKRVAGIFQNIVETQKPFTALENTNLHKNGQYVILETSGVPIFDGNGIFLGYRGIDRDITKRKQVEEQIKSSLKEKDILLQEIHHRVKNNLQIITSVLNLQSRDTDNEEVLRAFKDTQDRIKTMALVHEKLYKSEDLSKIDFKEYVRSLSSYLYRSYKTPSLSITLEVNVDNIFLKINTALTCGLIVNELVSNCLKHAFPDGGEGKIIINMDSDGKNNYILTVSDDGVGLPEDLDFRNTESLGLQLICTLTDQLEGTIELDRSTGTAFRISFEGQKKEERIE